MVNPRAGRGNSARFGHFAELSKYYQSDKWAIKKELYFLKKGKYCKACGSVRDIQVHHMTYEHFRAEPLSDLVSLCKTCHDAVTKLCRSNNHRDDRMTTMNFIRNRKK